MVTDRMYSRERHTDLRQVKWVDRLLDRRAGTGTGIEAQTAIGWGGAKTSMKKSKITTVASCTPEARISCR